ncbi:MAG: hypothetical protein L6V81_02240 [Clostridium sp.]|nr:MAG: hypothetical protein L6V81_02240 [Clostridium sp.]
MEIVLFNSSSNYNAYVGYMYGTPNSSAYSDEHKKMLIIVLLKKHAR